MESVEEDQVATLPKPLGVRYSQPGRYQLWKCDEPQTDGLLHGASGSAVKQQVHSPRRVIPFRMEDRKWTPRWCGSPVLSSQSVLHVKVWCNHWWPWYNVYVKYLRLCITCIRIDVNVMLYVAQESKRL
jgi:hypothetical protein